MSHYYHHQENYPLLQGSALKNVFKIPHANVLRIISKKNENKMGSGRETVLHQVPTQPLVFTFTNVAQFRLTTSY